ncbi:MAG TPA: hypothetical protein VJR23_18035 [Candidatus Acidoferrales bacterium]|nr:hypothetical protein [Candidatus Acidoferrales bacterium]
MRAPAIMHRSSNVQALAIKLPFAAGAGDGEMRDLLILIRDTLIVLSIQIGFRAVMLLRRWNM